MISRPEVVQVGLRPSLPDPGARPLRLQAAVLLGLCLTLCEAPAGFSLIFTTIGKIFLCPRVLDEELGFREPHVTKAKAIGLEFGTRLCLAPMPALSHGPTWPFWQNQHLRGDGNLSPATSGK